MQNEIQDSIENKRDRLFTVFLTILCQSFQALTVGGIALFLPMIREDLQMSFTQGGMLAAASTSVYALMQVPAGYLSDRFGPKKLYCIGILGTNVLSFTFGLVSQYWQAVANQILSGFCRSLVFSPGLMLLSGWFPPKRRATAMSLYLIGGFSGNIVLDILGPLLVAHFGWRFPFIAFASVGICSAIILVIFGKERPHPKEERTVDMAEVLQMLRSRVMWVCGAIQYVRLAVNQGIAFWLPTFLIEDKGISLQLTGVIIAMRVSLISPSNFLGGYASDRLQNPPLVIAVSLVILGITTALFATVDNLILLVVLICVNAIFVQMYFGPLFAVPIEMLGSRNAGMMSGLSNLFANIGSLTAISLLGLLKDATGTFQSGFRGISGLCFVGLLFTFLLARMRNRAVARKTDPPLA